MDAIENELMCRVGPGTSMGSALRRRWVPACMSSELPESDGAPLRVKLLGQWFVAFRDSNGNVGFLDEACPHRGASMAFARNEDCGLRCLWHGWQIAADGSLLETPNIADDHFKQRVKANAYDVAEMGGLVWVHLGAGPPPAKPDFQWTHVPDENRLIVVVEIDCNYVQPLEGLADSSHVGILHSNLISSMAGQTTSGRDGQALSQDQAPKLVVEPTDFGYHYAALRKVDGGHHARITAYAAPLTFFIAPGGQAFMSIPQDDTHSRFYNIFWRETERISDGPGREQLLDVFGLHWAQMVENGTQPRYPLTGDLGVRNTFTQDRDAMRNGSFTGLDGLTAEDAAMTDSMGPLADRGNEHLVPADLAVIRLRRILRSIAAEDADAPRRASNRANSSPPVEGVLGPDDDWHELVPHHRVAGGAIADSDLWTARAPKAIFPCDPETNDPPPRGEPCSTTSRSSTCTPTSAADGRNGPSSCSCSPRTGTWTAPSARRLPMRRLGDGVRSSSGPPHGLHRRTQDRRRCSDRARS